METRFHDAAPKPDGLVGATDRVAGHGAGRRRFARAAAVFDRHRNPGSSRGSARRAEDRPARDRARSAEGAFDRETTRRERDAPSGTVPNDTDRPGPSAGPG
jgi:hypothetical protein